jgi:hypothetical protein
VTFDAITGLPFKREEPVITKLPVILCVSLNEFPNTDEPFNVNEPTVFTLPLIFAEPVRVRVSMDENVELPETNNEPLITTPFDAVIDDNSAELPLTISFFQVGNFYSIYNYGFIVQYI